MYFIKLILARCFDLDVFESIRTNRSTRAYENKAIEKEKLSKILEAARLSASANNNQPTQFIAVSDKTTRESLLTAYPNHWFTKAPTIIVVCSNPDEAWSRQDGEEYWKVDAAIAAENMILVAHELGLGTCWVAAFNEEKAKELLGIPKKMRVIAMIPVGYPAEHKSPVTKRKPIEEIVHYERW